MLYFFTENIKCTFLMGDTSNPFFDPPHLTNEQKKKKDRYFDIDVRNSVHRYFDIDALNW